MNKSIAIVTSTFPPYRGGMGRVAELDAEQLASAGFDAHVYSPDTDKPGKRGEPAYGVHDLGAWIRYGNAAFAPAAAGLVRKHDLVILHYPFFGGAEPAALGRRLFGGKLAVMYHMDVVGSGGLGWFFRMHTRFVMPGVLKAADRVMVTSFDYAENSNISCMLRGDRDRFSELAPSVDGTAFSPGPKPPYLLNRYGLTREDRIILFVGALDKAHYFKGVPDLLKVFSGGEFARAKLVIVGSGDLRDDYMRRAESLGIADRVIFTGGVSGDELPDHYRLADVFVFPSVDKSEAFGIAALEALSCGVPAVASDLPGVRTIVRDGETGVLVSPGDFDSLKDGLCGLLNDDARRARYGENARRMVESGYTHGMRAQALEEIVRSLL